MNQSRRNTPRELKEGQKLLDQALRDGVQAKAALLVIHRVARSLSDPNPVKQREALDQLLKFADAHPLDEEMEKHL